MANTKKPAARKPAAKKPAEKKPNMNINTTKNIGSMSPGEANSAIEKEIKATYKSLRKAKTVRLKVNPDPQNKDIKAITVTLNGAKYTVPIGKYIDVPQDIADIIDRSNY